MRICLALSCFVTALSLVACETAPKTSAEREVLAAEVATTMTRFRLADPTLQ